MASIDDVVTKLQNGVSNLAQLVVAFQNAFPRINGRFTLAAGATTTVVTQPAISASGLVFFTPTSATAAMTQRTLGLYHNVGANVAGASFSISTQTGTALGTETFEYTVLNPS